MITLSTRSLTLIFIVLLAAVFRLYRIGDLAIFNFDQARNVIAERQMLLTKRPILLGPDDHFGGVSIYYGPVQFYVMAPALAISNFNPLGTYVWTAVLGIITTIIVYVVGRSLTGALFYAAYPWTVFYNRIDWLPCTITFFTATMLLALIKGRFFWVGLSIAFAIQLHTTAGVLFFVALAYLILKRPLLTVRNLSFLAFGLAVGFSPMIIFDLRHDFLYTKTYLNLLVNRPYKGLFAHYFLWAIPLVGVLWRYLPQKLSLLLVALCLFITIEWLATAPREIPRNPDVISQISRIIAEDNANLGRPFNVASFVDPDTRGTAYRYFLDLYGNKPLNYDQYNRSDYLYVITHESPEKILATNVYEITSFAPKRVTGHWQIEGENLYRLEK